MKKQPNEPEIVMITAAIRANSTRNGNPVWRLVLLTARGEIVAKTKPNAGWVYGLPATLEGRAAQVTMDETRRGWIITDMEVSPASVLDYRLSPS